MKNRNKSIIFTATAMLMVSLNAFNQFDGATNPFAGEGSIILQNGDTLHGRVNWRMKYVENNPTEIKFIPDNGPSAVYTSADLKEVIVYPADFETSEELQTVFYVSLPSMKKGSLVFYNRMIDGKIKVYLNRSSTVITNEVSQVTSEFDGIEFRYSKEQGLTVGPVYKVTYHVLESKTRFSSYFVSKSNAPLVKIDKDNYDNLFLMLFGDCPSIQQEITKNPDLRKFKNFMILTEVYNQLCWE